MCHAMSLVTVNDNMLSVLGESALSLMLSVSYQESPSNDVLKAISVAGGAFCVDRLVTTFHPDFEYRWTPSEMEIQHGMLGALLDNLARHGDTL